MKSGLVHLYTGEGKGKTTAAMGLCLRAAGHGLRVGIFQFCKGTPTGEIDAFSHVPHVQFHRAPTSSTKFYSAMDERDQKTFCAAQEVLLKEALRHGSDYDVLVLDEICAALSLGALSLEMVLDFLHAKPYCTEVILTGRNPPDELLPLCDYITNMQCVRHPMDENVPARRGIEY